MKHIEYQGMRNIRIKVYILPNDFILQYLLATQK